MAPGTDMALVAGYGKEFTWRSLAGMGTIGAGTIGTNSEDLLSAQYLMTVFPFGLTARYTSNSQFYVLAEEDLALVRSRRKPENRLGLAIHLALLRHPGQGS